MMSKKRRKRMVRRLKKNIMKSIRHMYYRITHPHVKLNIFEPGTRICEACGILLVVALVFYLISFNEISFYVCWIAAVIFSVLLILLKIEQHQEDADYEEWKRKNFN